MQSHYRPTKDSLTARVAQLASNSNVQSKLKAHGLSCQTVAWEDSSRDKNSCWGSNISDMTLKVDNCRMPLIRAPNYSDTTVDLTSDKLPELVVGNETGSGLSKVTLKEYLQNFHRYCGMPSTDSLNLYHERDDHVLTSAQACVLPVVNGKVEFSVDLYNYQSYSDEPAVLVIMCTSYGTSAQVVCGGSTTLYFNGNSTSRLFKAERLTEYRESRGKPKEGAMTSEEKALNGIYIFQVPLKVEHKPRLVPKMSCFSSVANKTYDTFGDSDEECDMGFGGSPELTRKFSSNSRPSRGMERAILTLGVEKGPYKGVKKASGDMHKLVRDTDRPIRLTVQFYMCTDSDEVSQVNLDDICNQIRHIYDKGCNEGSLVVDGPVTKPGVAVTPNPSRPTSTKTFVAATLNNNIL